MNKKVFTYITIIGTILGIVLSGVAIYDRIYKNDDIFLEQRVDPAVIKKYRDQGLDVKIEKGITISPREESDGENQPETE
jgi:hypothetical protein